MSPHAHRSFIICKAWSCPHVRPLQAHSQRPVGSSSGAACFQLAPSFPWLLSHREASVYLRSQGVEVPAQATGEVSPALALWVLGQEAVLGDALMQADCSSHSAIML